MIHFEEFTLDNGLRVMVHEDRTVEIAVMNILYEVGSRDEHPDKTGFAHLFEHLMFGGSINIPNYDEPLQKVGGENNAFTNTDITNYYLTVPAANIETGFWLESDRMLGLSFDPEVLAVQQKVVIEEFKQRYLNQPYGDVWLKLRPLVYKVHPYQWATIGKHISHIEKVTMEDVKDFFYRYYAPNNAILVVAGSVSLTQVRELAEKWFGPLPAQKRSIRQLPVEPLQTERRREVVEGDVPANALYKAFRMPGRFHQDFYAIDLLTDMLGHGHSSRLHQALVKEQEIFTSVSAYTSGSIDPGMLIISGRLKNGVELEQAEDALDKVLKSFSDQLVPDEELEKVKIQAESAHVFGEVEVMNRAMNLAFAKLSGDAALVNRENDLLRAVTSRHVHDLSNSLFAETNSSTLYYRSQPS